MSCPLLELLPSANILTNGSVTSCFEDDRLQLLLFCPGDPRHTRSIVDLGCIPSLLSDLPQASCPPCLLDLFFVLQRSHFHSRSSGSWPLRRKHRNFATHSDSESSPLIRRSQLRTPERHPKPQISGDLAFDPRPRFLDQVSQHGQQIQSIQQKIFRVLILLSCTD